MSDITDAVNTGVTVVKLVANHAGVQSQSGQYANALPPGVEAAHLTGWHSRDPKPTRRWHSDSEWYEILTVDWDFQVGIKWYYGGTTDGTNQFVDQVTVTLNVDYLPPDFTVDVTANFPPHGLMGSNGVAELGFTLVVEAKKLFGQLVSRRWNYDCVVRGDGSYSWTDG
jgi:hypothetical protein